MDTAHFFGDGRLAPAASKGDRERILLGVSQTRYNLDMKTATIPSVRVEPEFRDEVERVLGKDESLSQFVEAAVRASVRQRMDQAEFVARGMSSLASARKSGEYFDAGEVMRRLREKLDSARTRQARAR